MNLAGIGGGSVSGSGSVPIPAGTSADELDDWAESVGAAGGAAACSAVGLGAAAPICGKVGKLIVGKAFQGYRRLFTKRKRKREAERAARANREAITRAEQLAAGVDDVVKARRIELAAATATALRDATGIEEGAITQTGWIGAPSRRYPWGRGPASLQGYARDELERATEQEVRAYEEYQTGILGFSDSPTFHVFRVVSKNPERAQANMAGLEAVLAELDRRSAALMAAQLVAAEVLLVHVLERDAVADVAATQAAWPAALERDGLLYTPAIAAASQAYINGRTQPLPDAQPAPWPSLAPAEAARSWWLAQLLGWP